MAIRSISVKKEQRSAILAMDVTFGGKSMRVEGIQVGEDGAVAFDENQLKKLERSERIRCASEVRQAARAHFEASAKLKAKKVESKPEPKSEPKAEEPKQTREAKPSDLFGSKNSKKKSSKSSGESTGD